MALSLRSLSRLGCLAIAVSLPLIAPAQTEHHSEPTATAAADPALTSSTELPDAPSAVAQSTNSAQQQAQPVQQNQSVQNQTAGSQPETAPPAPIQEEQKLQRPVGTAAAEAPIVSGVTAAQPAGVAVAPAKQRRVRTIVLKVGAIVGAGVALGTTLALTMGTPSKPPGAH